MRDEARHIGFGVLSLEKIYSEMTSAELREREDFVIEAAYLMRDRLLMHEVWERLGWEVDLWVSWSLETPFMIRVPPAPLFQDRPQPQAARVADTTGSRSFLRARRPPLRRPPRLDPGRVRDHPARPARAGGRRRSRSDLTRYNASMRSRGARSRSSTFGFAPAPGDASIRPLRATRFRPIASRRPDEAASRCSPSPRRPR